MEAEPEEFGRVPLSKYGDWTVSVPAGPVHPAAHRSDEAGLRVNPHVHDSSQAAGGRRTAAAGLRGFDFGLGSPSHVTIMCGLESPFFVRLDSLEPGITQVTHRNYIQHLITLHSVGWKALSQNNTIKIKLYNF